MSDLKNKDKVKVERLMQCIKELGLDKKEAGALLGNAEWYIGDIIRRGVPKMLNIIVNMSLRMLADGVDKKIVLGLWESKNG